jgi:hypothetical protein
LNYKAPPTLARMMRSNAFVRIVVGPVGSGKSSACVIELLRRASEQAPDAGGVRRTRFAVVRNTYRELQDTTRKTFESWIPLEAGKWREADFAFDVKAKLSDGTSVESEILFRALDKPKDVKKLLSLELTGAYFNEIREIPKTILDAMKARVIRYPAVKDGGQTWKGIWADTNPWHNGHWGYSLFKKPPPGWELYRQPSGRSPLAENKAHLDPEYYDLLLAGADTEWIKTYIDGEDAASAVGSIWGDAIAGLGEQREFAHPTDEVFTSWDIGRADSTAIWFWRVRNRNQIEVLDWYENSLQGPEHYFDVVDGKGFKYVKHWLPHDAAALTLASQSSFEDQCRLRWPGKVAIGPNLSLLDGLAAARWLLERDRIRFHPRCSGGLDALRAYRREWDPDARAYSNTPVHDWSSHTADAFRYLACVVKVTGLIMAARPGPPKPAAPQQGHDGTWTLDKLFADNEADKHGRRRI